MLLWPKYASGPVQIVLIRRGNRPKIDMALDWTVDLTLSTNSLGERY